MHLGSEYGLADGVDEDEDEREHGRRVPVGVLSADSVLEGRGKGLRLNKRHGLDLDGRGRGRGWSRNDMFEGLRGIWEHELVPLTALLGLECAASAVRLVAWRIL